MEKCLERQREKEGDILPFLFLQWETDKWRAGDTRGIQTDKWGGNTLCCCWIRSQRQVCTVLPLSCLVSSTLCVVVDADVSGLICLHSAVRHPTQTMKQACGPNTLPSCFRLPIAPVRTSSHVTWRVIPWREGDAVAVTPHPRSPQNPCSPGPTVLFHTHAKPLCTNALLLCQHTYRQAHTHQLHSYSQPTHRVTHAYTYMYTHLYTLHP